MLLVLPLSHDSGEVRRFPWITLTLIAVNIIVYVYMVFTPSIDIKPYMTRLVKFYIEHPYLEFPADVYDKMPDEIKRELKFHTKSDPSDSKFKFELDDEQMELNKLINEFNTAYSQIFFRKYGYIPSEGGFFPIFTSMFVHNGFFHLFFNMLFLWLSGFKLEDLWGRIFFPVFYFAGGISAALLHAQIYPNSNIPLVGASGAIAALMGAFLFRLYRTRIHMVYVFFLFVYFKKGRFSAPAYLILPVWLLFQVFEAYISTGWEISIAYYAHIGGFIFGAACAFLMKITRFEEALIEPSILKKSGSFDFEKLSLDEKTQFLQEVSKNNPDDTYPHEELARIYLTQKRNSYALRECKEVISIHLKNENNDAVVKYIQEISNIFPEISLNPENQMKLIRLFENRRMFFETAKLYRQLYLFYKNMDNGQEAASALIQYGDNCLLNHQPNDAGVAYKTVAGNYIPYLSSQQKEHLKSKLVEVKKLLSHTKPQETDLPINSKTAQQESISKDTCFTEITCPKCGNINKSKGLPQDECPKCGVVYAKFRKLKEDASHTETETGGAKKIDEKSPHTKKLFTLKYPIGACAILILVFFTVKNRHTIMSTLNEIKYYINIDTKECIEDRMAEDIRNQRLYSDIEDFRENSLKALNNRASEGEEARMLSEIEEDDMSTEEHFNKLILLNHSDQQFVDYVKNHSLMHNYNEDGLTPLMLACMFSQNKAVKELIENGSRIDDQDHKGWTALMFAILFGNDDAVEILLKQKAEINSYNDNGTSAFTICIVQNNTKILKLLLTYGADVKPNNETPPLYLAACNGHYEIVKILLEEGVDPNVRMEDKTTPLDCAIRNHFYRIETILRKYGAV